MNFEWTEKETNNLLKLLVSDKNLNVFHFALSFIQVSEASVLFDLTSNQAWEKKAKQLNHSENDSNNRERQRVGLDEVTEGLDASRLVKGFLSAVAGENIEMTDRNVTAW